MKSYKLRVSQCCTAHWLTVALMTMQHHLGKDLTTTLVHLTHLRNLEKKLPIHNFLIALFAHDYTYYNFSVHAHTKTRYTGSAGLSLVVRIQQGCSETPD